MKVAEVEDNKPVERLTISQVIEKGFKPRKVFLIMINDKPYQVWDIDNYEHQNGKWNGTPCTWWLDYSNEDHERELIPYVEIGVHRICWEIRYKQKNYVKHKWGEWDIRNSGNLEIFANGKRVYQCGARDLEYAMANAMIMPYKLMEHPFDFLNPEKEDGRKIWYYGLPATVKVREWSAEIVVYPDFEKIHPNKWWKLYKERKKPVDLGEDKSEVEVEDEDDVYYDSHTEYINHGDPMYDGMINWFRK